MTEAGLTDVAMDAPLHARFDSLWSRTVGTPGAADRHDHGWPHVAALLTGHDAALETHDQLEAAARTNLAAEADGLGAGHDDLHALRHDGP